MSPLIFIEFFIDPIQAKRLASTFAGTISASGLPKRVTLIGFPVERTRSSSA
jgi:hypothetical protein